MPSALLEGKTVNLVHADGVQTELAVTIDGDAACFALELGAPAAVLHIA